MGNLIAYKNTKNWPNGNFHLLKAIVLASCVMSAPPLVSRDRSKLEEFNIKGEPSEADWVYFLKMPPKEREALWSYNAKQHYHLKDWSWGWRLGWVRVCNKEKSPFCFERLREALKDRALVVRAEAATKIGESYEGSGDARVLTLLESAYKDARNQRNGKPMYVQQRILEAIHRVSGTDADNLGRRLAKSDPGNLKYWNQISRF